MLENTELKKKIARLEEEKLELKQSLINISNGGQPLGPASALMNGGLADMNEVYQLKQSNGELQKRVEFLQKRERELMD
jgi:kinesin family protein 12